jgi:alpha-galactosidase/6-phospho-beta-glucosidase family protein
MSAEILKAIKRTMRDPKHVSPNKNMHAYNILLAISKTLEDCSLSEAAFIYMYKRFNLTRPICKCRNCKSPCTYVIKHGKYTEMCKFHTEKEEAQHKEEERKKRYEKRNFKKTEKIKKQQERSEQYLLRASQHKEAIKEVVERLKSRKPNGQ